METKKTTFADLRGETIDSVDGMRVGSELVVFHLASGQLMSLSHEQDCCEHVSIAEIHGDESDLLGEVLYAEESSQSQVDKPDEYADSWSWTFYRIITNKGSVVLRWLGESNGYYSESVDARWK